MDTKTEKAKRTLLILGYMGQLFFYGGLLVTVVGTILTSMGLMDNDAARVAVPVLIFGFAMAWGAGNNRVIVELQERVEALENANARSEPAAPASVE